MSITLDNWLTKSQAAQELGVSEKTIDRMTAAQRLEKRDYKQPGKSAIVLINRADVERIKAERAPHPFIVSTAVQPVSTAAVQPVSRPFPPMPAEPPVQKTSELSTLLSDVLSTLVQRNAASLSELS